MSESKAGSGFLNIPQAAKILKVTEKTIRNYIEKGILEAEKWNAAWRIENGKIREIYYKKYGRKLEEISLDSVQQQGAVRVPKEEYDESLRRSGQLDFMESQAKEMAAEIKALNERLMQLEASAASGWTEARKYKEDSQALEEKLNQARESESEAQQEVAWLRRELDRVRGEQGQMQEALEGVRTERQAQENELRGKEKELTCLREELGALRQRYRRDSFLG